MKKNKIKVYEKNSRMINTSFKEVIEVLEYSIMLVDIFGVKSFNNVIAGQLRLLLCDTSVKYVKGDRRVIDNSLIHKVNIRPKLYPVSDFIELENSRTAFMLGQDLFNYNKDKIDLKTWLNQVIVKMDIDDELHQITIFDLIKGFSNKSGGVHVDSHISTKELIIDIHAGSLLRGIAKGFLKSIGKDFSEQVEANLSHLVKTAKNKSEASI